HNRVVDLAPGIVFTNHGLQVPLGHHWYPSWIADYCDGLSARPWTGGSAGLRGGFLQQSADLQHSTDGNFLLVGAQGGGAHVEGADERGAGFDVGLDPRGASAGVPTK
ncbi:MAG TPA: hypothetical protein VK784_16400, partial [Pseudonocardiaceae bacterium]|nr:hypothetical protein [Pseudonocardiaceae bacterium]